MSIKIAQQADPTDFSQFTAQDTPAAPQAPTAAKSVDPTDFSQFSPTAPAEDATEWPVYQGKVQVGKVLDNHFYPNESYNAKAPSTYGDGKPMTLPVSRVSPPQDGPRTHPQTSKAPQGLQNVQPHRSPAGAVQSLSAVKSMQAAILTFSKVLASAEAMSFQKGKVTQTGRQQDSKGHELGGHDAFTSFLLNRYVKPTAGSGQGYVDQDMSAEEHKSTGTDIPEAGSFRNMISTLQHVGAPHAGENVPDGVWGERTNNALKDALAIAQGIFQFAKDMGFKLDTYAKALEDFKSTVPADVKSIKDQSSLANKLTQLIQTVTQLAVQFKKQIMENGSISNFLSQEKPLFTGGQADQFTKEESQQLQQYLATKGLSFQDLATVDGLKNYLKRPNATKEELSDALSEIQEKLFGGQK